MSTKIPIADLNLARRYGAKWKNIEHNLYEMSWSLANLKDFYLCEVLMHKIGHALDDWNAGYKDRENFADAFATEHGYLPLKAKRANATVKKRHHKS